MKRIPVTTGLLVCDQVIVEEGTRNVTLVNCFSHRIVDDFPATGVPMVAVAFLTDGLGDIPIEIRVQRLDTLDEVHRVGTRFHFTDPLNTLRCTVRLHGCTFPVAGHYEVSLVADGETLAQRRIVIRQKENTV